MCVHLAGAIFDRVHSDNSHHRQNSAQTRMVSAGDFWPSQQELSRYLKYMARARIPEFESDMPSHAVWSLWAMSGVRNYAQERPPQELRSKLAGTVSAAA